MLTVGANLVFALLPAVSPPGDHKDRPYRGLIQSELALVSGNRVYLAEYGCQPL